VERQGKFLGNNKVKFRTSSKKISFVCNISVYCEGVDCKVTGVKFMVVFITRRDAACFSWFYNHSAVLSPWEQYILCPFWRTSIRQLLCLLRVEAVKLAQAGFGDFLADSGVSRLKGKCDDNKEVYFVDTICNSAGHK